MFIIATMTIRQPTLRGPSRSRACRMWDFLSDVLC
uniref:Uncharacterized protein n=1 Tax=Anopheles albimanus TaxID=7167 RepID=A0A182FZK5_ANOAL